jgi:hypothetical protein
MPVEIRRAKGVDSIVKEDKVRKSVHSARTKQRKKSADFMVRASHILFQQLPYNFIVPYNPDRYREQWYKVQHFLQRLLAATAPSPMVTPLIIVAYPLGIAYQK